MAFHRKEYRLASTRKQELLDISEQLSDAVGEAGIPRNLACMYTPSSPSFSESEPTV